MSTKKRTVGTKIPTVLNGYVAPKKVAKCVPDADGTTYYIKFKNGYEGVYSLCDDELIEIVDIPLTYFKKRRKI